MRSLEPDFLYRLDVLLANRPDRGTISQSLAEGFGVSKTSFHQGLVGAGALGVGMTIAKNARTPIGLIAGLLLTGFVARAAFEYLEAPRQLPTHS